MERGGDGELTVWLGRLRMLSDAVGIADSLDAVLDEALECLGDILGVERSSILLFDEHGVMRFRAWRGLSEEYRRAVDGHSPWGPDERDALPILVEDVAGDEGLATFSDVFTREGIGALAFVPLLHAGKLLGKFMLYFAEPHRFTELEVEAARVVASHIGFAIERRRVEEELRRSSEELDIILRGVGDGITVIDREDRVVYANQAAADILGCPDADAMIGMPPEEIFERFETFRESGEPYDPTRLPSRLAGVEDREVRDVILFRRRGVDEVRHASVAASPIVDRDGVLRFVVIIFRDITERVRAHGCAVEAATRLSRLQHITAALAEATTERDVARAVLEAACEALGAADCVIYLREGDALRAAHRHDSGSRRLDPPPILPLSSPLPVCDAYRGGAPVFLGSAAERRARYPALASLHPPEAGGAHAAFAVAALGAVAIAYDSDRAFSAEDHQLFAAIGAASSQALERGRLLDAEREARAAAEAAQRRASFLAESSALLGSSLDYQATLERVVRAAVPVMADWATIDVVENGDHALVALYHRDPGKVELARKLREEYPLQPEARIGPSEVMRCGESQLLREIPGELLASVAHDERHLEILRGLGLTSAVIAPLRVGERCLGTITFIREGGAAYTSDDLRIAESLGNRAAVAIENARLYRAESEARQQARNAERRKDEFLAILGHELRNPLAPIVTALELMKMDPAASARPREVIERQVRYLERLVDDLLDISRIARGKVDLRWETVELSVVARDAIEVASPLLEERGHELAFEVPEEGLPVSCDRVRLAQVITNLVTNAAKYTPPGGHVDVTARRLDGSVRVAVRDDGIGIEPELQPHLFDLFVQGGEPHGQRRGLGLGLPIVQRLVALHEGEISAHSPGPGQGSLFEVTLPLAEGPAAGASRRASVPDGADTQPHATSRRILIVDDNTDAAELLAMGLGRAGHDTVVAPDGPSALSAAEQFSPDVALLDIGLPVMDGYELARRLRENARKDLRLIAITGYGQAHDRERARQAGFHDHFVKPISLERLVSALAR